MLGSQACQTGSNIISMLGIVLLIGSSRKKCHHDGRLRLASRDAKVDKSTEDAIFEGLLLRFRPHS